MRGGTFVVSLLNPVREWPLLVEIAKVTWKSIPDTSGNEPGENL